MIKALIASILIGVISNGIQAAINYFKSEKIKDLKNDLIEEQSKLANEIRRSQEKKK